jgi:phosphate-selective porin OprO/OprP
VTLAGFAFAAWLAGPALADDVGGGAVGVDGGKPVVEKLLDIMLGSGQIDRGQYDALLDQARQEQQEAAAAVARASESPETPPVSLGAKDWSFKWSNGFKLEREDGAFKLKFGGRIMTDFAFMWPGRQLADSLLAAGIDPKDGSGVEFRRARLFFEGTVYERVFFKAQYDFAGSDDSDGTKFKDVYVGLKKLGPVGAVRVGHFKEPFLLQETTSSKYITFMERGLNSVFFPGRNVGIMAENSHLSKKLTWQLGFFRNNNDSDGDDKGFDFDDWSEASYDLSARLVGAPLYSEDGAKVVHLGGGYIHQFRFDQQGALLRYRQRPETHLAQRWVDTTRFNANDSDVVNLELAGVWGPFSAQAEFTNSWVTGGPGQRNSQFWGTYAFVSWFITGEHRNYDLGKGRFGRVKPKANFNPAKGDWGAWEVAARYSYLDLNDQDIRGGTLWDVTAGVNWYLYPNLRLMWNYVHGDVRDRIDDGDPIDGAGDIFQMRVQLDF